MENYKERHKEPDAIKETHKGYEHSMAYQAAYDFSVHLHNKLKSFPKCEKFALSQEIRVAMDTILDEIETYEVTKTASHLYTADRMKRRLLRKLRLAYDLKFSAMNSDALFYCARQIGTIGKLIGGLIESEKKKKKGSC